MTAISTDHLTELNILEVCATLQSVLFGIAEVFAMLASNMGGEVCARKVFKGELCSN
jgi:hypothetical protein